MKKITQLWLLCLLTIVVIGASTGCTAKAKKVYHEKRAEKFFAAGQFDRAEIEYLNVLKSDRENARAYAQLGGIYYEGGRLQRAAFFLAKALTLATNDLDLSLKLGFIYSTGGKFQDAQNLANFVLDHDPRNAEAPLLLAEAAVLPRDITAARQKLQTLLRSGPSAILEVALGNLSLKERELEKAAAAFKRAQALDAKASAVNMALGSLSWAQNDLKQAELYFKQAAEVSPPHSPRRMQYARFKIQTGSLVEGRQFLEAMLKQSPDFLPALLSLAEIAARENKFDECNALLAKVLARDEDNFGAMLFLGQLKQAQGNPAEAVVAFEQLLRIYPLSPQANYYLALAALAAGDANKSLSNVNRALELQPDYPEAIMLQAQNLLRGGNANPVIVTLEKLRQKQPGLLPAQMLLADAYRLLNRTRDAVAIYQSLEKSDPKNVQIPLLLGSAYLQLKDGEAARQAFRRALLVDPDNLPAVEQLVEADLAEKNFTAAGQRIAGELARRPKQLELYLIQAKVFIMQGSAAQAEAVLLKAIELEPKNPNAYLLLAQIYLDAKQNQKSLAKLAQAVDCSPKNIPALMLMATIHTADKDYQGAASDYEKVLAIDPKFSPAMNNYAYLCSENLNQLDRAYVLAHEARNLLPYDPYTADTLGWISLKRGDYSTAYGLLNESAAKLTDNAEIQYHCGFAAYMLGEEAAARTALSLALKLSQDFAGRVDCLQALSVLNVVPQTADAAVRELLAARVLAKADDVVALKRWAQILERDNQPEKALQSYEKIVGLNPKDFNSTMSLARLYAAKDVAKAYELAKAAYKLSPYDPDALQLLGYLAADTGDFKLATSLYQETIKKRTDDAALYAGLARVAFAIGKVPEAQGALASALKLNMAAPVAAEVKRMAQLIQIASASTPTANDQTLIAEVLRAEPKYLPALAAQAAVAEKAGDVPSAISTHEKILTLYPDFAPSQKQLVLLYAKDLSKASRAYDLAIKVRDFYPNDLALTKAIGVILVGKADYARAVSLLKQCAAVSGNDAEIFFYLGTAQFKLKNLTDSKTSLQRALELKLTGPNAEAARQMLTTLK